MSTVLIVAASVFLLMLLYVFMIFPSTRRHPDREKYIGTCFAHRGLHGNGVPENTLTAFKKAMSCGYGIEFDVHLTADNEIVVFHDKTLERLFGINENVEDKTLAELKELTFPGSDEKIPSLKEVLELVDGRVPLMVEFKSYKLTCDDLCSNTDKLLREYKGDYCIECFNPFPVFWYRRNHKDVFRGQLALNARGKEYYAKIASSFICNFLARPDFVCYEQEKSHDLNFLLQKKFGAYCAGWTFKSTEEIETKKEEFKTFVFEDFEP